MGPNLASMKICKRCVKPGEFYGRRAVCKDCVKKENRKRLEDPEKRRAYLAYQKEYQATWGRKHRQDRFAWLDEIKANPCMDCGHSFPPECMDFDHRDPSQKLFDVSRAAVSGNSLQLVKDEVAKCDLVCANCHRIRTARQQNRRRLRSQSRREAPGAASR